MADKSARRKTANLATWRASLPCTFYNCLPTTCNQIASEFAHIGREAATLCKTNWLRPIMIYACCEFDPINKNEEVSNKPKSSLPVECDNDICYKCRLGKCLEREVHTLCGKPQACPTDTHTVCSGKTNDNESCKNCGGTWESHYRDQVYQRPPLSRPLP